MDEFKVIVAMNDAMIELLREKNENYEENLKIRNYLKDEGFFFKIDKINAYEILQNVGIKQDKIESVYKKLIAPNVFYDLLHKGKLKIDDEYLVIKYETYRKK